MPNIIGIRREDLSKTGEKRVAITPTIAQQLVESGHQVLVQPGIHPQAHDNKRAFPDAEYEQAGAHVTEDLDQADVIFGLKEVDIPRLIPNKAYLFFSHTHKGQVKNRPLLHAMMSQKITLFDYELIVDERNRRIVKAFTYFAGYAGMTDSLWTLGRRWKMRGIDSAFAMIPQSIEREDLPKIRKDIQQAGKHIAQHGTPESEPPVIITILGTGKTSKGSQSMLKHLPIQKITLDQLEDTYHNGDRRFVYLLILDVSGMYRIKPGQEELLKGKKNRQIIDFYLNKPHHFESNLDQIIPFTTILMNCILWGPEFPRVLTRDNAASWWEQQPTLQVIGDITCDPEGAIEFSKETWITDPVFIYDPATRRVTDGFEGEGIAVMAVTNLPCEFPADASAQFSEELHELIFAVADADLDADTPEAAGLPDALEKAAILWKGKLTPAYEYMQGYVG